MNVKRPITIIGGNIAGLSAAYHLSRMGCPVTVYETKIWNKPCGGAITVEFAQYLAKELDIDLNIAAKNILPIQFGFKGNRRLQTEGIFTVISRQNLQAQLIERISRQKDVGVIFKRISPKDCNRFSSQTILATGFSGFSRQILKGHWHRREHFTAIRFHGHSDQIRRIGTHLMVFDSRFKGYGWVFIEGSGKFNIGIGAMAPEIDLNQKFNDFINLLKLNYNYPADIILNQPAIWKIPVALSPGKNPISFLLNGVEFVGVGDTLGLAHPVMAAGIEPAWQSGWLVAESYNPSTHQIDMRKYRQLLKANLRLTSRKPIDQFVSMMLRNNFIPGKDGIGFLLFYLFKRQVVARLKKYPWFAMVHDGTRKTGFRL